MTRIPLNRMLVLILLLSSCSPMSKTVSDDEMGWNGSFERITDGKPVHWNVYTSATAKSGDFDMTVDSTQAYNGTRSIFFTVRECSDRGGRFSPGLFSECAVDANSVYTVQFSVKNSGTLFSVLSGGIMAKEGHMVTLIRSKEIIDGWKQFRYDVPVPDGCNRLRFEASILSPGKFWIDNVIIEKKP